MNYKVCSKCGERKPATNEYFHKQKKGKYGLRACCKECQKQYREEHKEDIKKRKKQYCEANKEARKHYNKQYYEANKEAKKQYGKQYYEANKEELKQYRETHKEAKKQYSKQYRKSNWIKVRVNAINRRGAGKVIDEDIKTILDKFKYSQFYICPYCGNLITQYDEVNIDHIEPVSKGGTNEINNLVPCCSNCNMSKRAKDFHKWYKTRYYYSAEREQMILDYKATGIVNRRVLEKGVKLRMMALELSTKSSRRGE